MESIYAGIIAGVLTLFLPTLGVLAGWKAKGAYDTLQSHKRSVETTESEQEQEKEALRQLKEEQTAWSKMLEYDINTAYGNKGSGIERFGGGR